MARARNFHIGGELPSGHLVPLLEELNRQNRESIHAVFVGGATMPARLRVLVDLLVTRMRG